MLRLLPYLSNTILKTVSKAISKKRTRKGSVNFLRFSFIFECNLWKCYWLSKSKVYWSNGPTGNDSSAVEKCASQWESRAQRITCQVCEYRLQLVDKISKTSRDFLFRSTLYNCPSLAKYLGSTW